MNLAGVFVRGLTSQVERSLAYVRSQAPAARMIGEFAVKTGLSVVKNRLAPGQPATGTQPAAAAENDPPNKDRA